MKPLIYLIFDGVDHSVFAGQVLTPFLKKLEQYPEYRGYIVSFERSSLSKKLIAQYKSQYPSITFIIVKRGPLLGQMTLKFLGIFLKYFLRSFNDYEIIARGPLAGNIAFYALDFKKCHKLTIQARGLLAQEYAYHAQLDTQFDKLDGIKKWLRKFRYWQYYSLESNGYGKRKNFSYSSYVIESVSPALSRYLIDEFGIDENKIILAHEDIPDIIPKSQIALWRDQIRKELSIHESVKVYCYSGAFKSWQCPKKILDFFNEQSLLEPQALLLVLTMDISLVNFHINEMGISPDRVRVLRVSYDKIYEYLAAADIGLLFREPHIVSWVSRPVKAMEYEAVGLSIIHNGTVAWLNERYSNFSIK